ncbi:MAG: trehalose-phosphatase, partial [Pseudomonadota bacterium]
MHNDPLLPPPPAKDPRHIALFLDVDGTLLSFAQTPDAVHVDDGLRTLLADLEHRCDGALALVSGRSIASIDSLFDPLTLCVAGSHGLEIRDRQAFRRLGEALPEDTLAALRSLRDRAKGSLLEEKQFGAALHYRRSPELGSILADAVRDLHTPINDRFQLIEGDHVLELSASNANKGSAIAAFCDRQPWRDRQPVFVGDDTTDEAGFDAVNARGGLAIRVGSRPRSAARFQLDNVAAVKAWLRTLVIAS